MLLTLRTLDSQETLTPNNASFASITSTRDNPNDPRSFQFAAKLYFGQSR